MARSSEKFDFYAHQGEVKLTEENERNKMETDQTQIPKRATLCNYWFSNQAMITSQYSTIYNKSRCNYH